MTIAGRPLPHESARGHVTGEALYTDDLLGRFPHLLHAWPVTAPHAHAAFPRERDCAHHLHREVARTKVIRRCTPLGHPIFGAQRRRLRRNMSENPPSEGSR